MQDRQSHIFEVLPTDLVLHIYNLIPLADLAKVALLNKLSLQLTLDNIFWKNKYKRHFFNLFAAIENKSLISWRNEFRKSNQQYTDNRFKNIFLKINENSFDYTELKYDDLWKANNDKESILKAIYNNRPQQIRSIFYYMIVPFYLDDKGKIRITSKDMYDLTILDWAAICDQLNYVKDLLSQGAAVNTISNTLISPLIWALEWSCDEIVYELLIKGANTNVIPKSSPTALIIAICKRSFKLVNELLNRGADVNLAASDGTTPLMLAARNGRLEIIKLLLSHGVKVNTVANDGSSPIYNAVSSGNIEAVLLILANGGDINYVRKQTMGTLLHLASECGYFHIARLLISEGIKIDQTKIFDLSSLILAAMRGHDSVVQLLINKGANINHVDDEGGTALFAACQYGHSSVVKTLLANNADTGITFIRRVVASFIEFSKKYNIEDTINYFISNARAKNITGSDIPITAFEVAVIFDQTEVLKQFVETKKCIEGLTSNGNILAVIAAYNGNAQILRWLDQYGIDLSQNTHIGRTPLEIAISRNQEGAIDFLINYKAKSAHYNSIILRDFLSDKTYWQEFTPKPLGFMMKKTLPSGIYDMLTSESKYGSNLSNLQEIARARMNHESIIMRNKCYIDNMGENPLNRFYQAVIDAKSITELEDWILAIHQINIISNENNFKL